VVQLAGTGTGLGQDTAVYTQASATKQGAGDLNLQEESSSSSTPQEESNSGLQI